MSDLEKPTDGDITSSSWLVLDETVNENQVETTKLEDLSCQPKSPINSPEETVCKNQIETTKLEDLSCQPKSPLNSTEMKRNRLGTSTPSNVTQARRGKRKRKSALSSLSSSPFVKKTKLTPSPSKRRRNNRNRKKSVIVIDSETESEPEISVVEINDESTILEISDDEIGVCSGSVSSSVDRPVLKSTHNLQTLTNGKNPLPVDDKTGAFIPKKRNSPIKATATNSELYQPLTDKSAQKTGLRPIVIDGCNVAFGHGRDRFSSLGLKICIDYFKSLGHEVRAFVPQFRKHHSATLDPQILDALEKDGTLSFTPSRRTDGKMIVSYDDRFIVQYADATGGIVVSRDNYRDLLNENPEWKDTVHKRLLMYTWVGDTIMFPKDPLGRGGPTLQDFLKY